MFQRLWVRIPAPYTGLTFFTCMVVKIVIFFERPKINDKRGRGWPNLKKEIKGSKGGSPGLVVMGGDSCSKVCGFESHHCILDGHFSHLFVVKL